MRANDNNVKEYLLNEWKIGLNDLKYARDEEELHQRNMYLRKTYFTAVKIFGSDWATANLKPKNNKEELDIEI